MRKLTLLASVAVSLLLAGCAKLFFQLILYSKN